MLNGEKERKREESKKLRLKFPNKVRIASKAVPTVKNVEEQVLIEFHLLKIDA